jgi:glycerol uptake facilitator-like aquaporin
MKGKIPLVSHRYEILRRANQLNIGLTLIVIELVGAGLSGAGVNPARVLCAAIVEGQWETYEWIYFLG